MLELLEQRLAMSYEAFQQWDGAIHAEWVKEEALLFMPPKTVHQRLARFICNLLSLYAEALELGEVMLAPFTMLLADSAREPDLFFVAKENLARLTPENFLGPADLVVEIISDSSVFRDRVDKFYEYQANGVREYWLIDPRSGKQRIDCYWLTPQTKFQAILPDAEGRYHSVVLAGFWFQATWFWQEPLPNPLRALAAIAPQTLRDALP